MGNYNIPTLPLGYDLETKAVILVHKSVSC